jgi:hypothetical protein
MAADLLASSQVFARSAVTAYSTESWEFFYLHLATALEHLAKSVLVSADPVLIADSRADFETQLHLTGYGHKATTPDLGSVRTISLTEALERAGRLIENYKKPQAGVRLLIEARNGFVHLGQRSKVAAELVLGDVADCLDQLLAERGAKSADYWGEAADLVAEHRGKRLDAIEASYRRRIQAAKDRYSAKFADMDDATRRVVITALTQVDVAADFSEVPRDCPACDEVGTLYVSLAEPTWEPDYDSDGDVTGMYVESIRIFGLEFGCRVCGLNLDDRELELAGMGELTLAEGEFDTQVAQEAFEEEFEPDDY